MINLIITPRTFETFVKHVKDHPHSVCILSTKTYALTSANLKQKNIDLAKYFFIDTTGKEEHQNVLPIKQNDITSLSLTIQQSAQLFPKTTVIFDSFTSLTEQIPPEILGKFAEFITAQLSKADVDCDIIIDDKTPPEGLLETLKEIADNVRKA